MMTDGQLRRAVFVCLGILLALAWYFRYTPMRQGFLVWDRVGHRTCIAMVGEPIRCGR